MTLIEKADALAARAHEGQMRKESPTPYITHPRAVAEILKRHGFGDTVVAAALVHDTVEDTPVTIGEVRQELGDEVATLVTPLTHDDTLPWEDKKRGYIEAVRHASPDAKAIATADKIHNLQCTLAAYAEQGPAYWSHFNAGRDKKVWFEESMLTMLQDSWHHPLVDEYARLVEQMRALV